MITKEERAVLEGVLAHIGVDGERSIPEKTFEAFTRWLDLGRTLSDAQRKWLYGVAERLGVVGAAPSENIFSGMSPEKQARQREAAKKVVLPWEKK